MVPDFPNKSLRSKAEANKAHTSGHRSCKSWGPWFSWRYFHQSKPGAKQSQTDTKNYETLWPQVLEELGARKALSAGVRGAIRRGVHVGASAAVTISWGRRLLYAPGTLWLYQQHALVRGCM